MGLGATFVVLKQTGGWTVGALANHIWPVAVNEERDNLSTTFVQLFVSSTTKMPTTHAVDTESTSNWETSQWTVPLNLLVAQVLKIGKQTVRIQFGGRYYAEGPSGAPECGLRLAFTFLFPQVKHAAPDPSSCNTPHFPALRSDPSALSAASRSNQIPSSQKPSS